MVISCHHNKRKGISFIFLLMMMVIISGCHETANPSINEQDIPATPIASEDALPVSQTPEGDERFSWEALGFDLITDPSMFWTSDIQFDALAGEQGPVILIDGLKHENPMVQWYSTYKLIDYWDKIDPATIKECLPPLLESKEEYVKKGAAFALALLNQTYDSPYLYKSPHADQYAFVLFPEAYLKDGRVFLVKDHHITIIYQGFNAGIVSWSPDGERIGITEMTRITQTAVLANIKTGEAITSPSSVLTEQLEAYSSVLNLEPYRDFRPDPYESIIEWSPDSQKVLLKYNYVGERTDDNQFYFVFDVQGKKATWVLKVFEEASDSTKPEGFNWNEPDYGLPTGALDKIPSVEKLPLAKEAMGALVQAINTKDVDRVKDFVDPSLQRNNAQLGVALEDFSHCFGNLPIQEFSYAGLDPTHVNAFRFMVSNGHSSRPLSVQWKDGAFYCTHPFLSLSTEVHQLIDEYTKDLKEEDIQSLLRILSLDEAYTEEKVRKMLDNYKMGLDLGKMTIVFSNHEGNNEAGTFYYDVRNEAGNNLNGIHVNVEQGKLTLMDSWIP